MPTHGSPPYAAVMADRTIGPATKLAYIALWHYAGGAGHVTITAGWLGSVCGRDRRSALDWLAELKAHGLVTLGERNRRRGAIELFVFAPHPETPPAAADPQQRLPLPAAAHAPAGGSPPRGGCCAETPAQETPENAGNSGHPEVRAGVVAQKPPRHAVCVNEFKELEEFTLPNYQRVPSKVFEFNEAPRPIGDAALAAAIDRMGQRTAPSAQKAALKTRIRQAVGTGGRGEGPAEYVVGAAADMIVFGGVPEDDLDGIFRDLAAMRAAGTLRNAPAFFHSAARKLAARHGFKWPAAKPAGDETTSH